MGFNFTKEMLVHLAPGGERFQNFELSTKEMLIHLAAEGENCQNSELFTKEITSLSLFPSI